LDKSKEGTLLQSRMVEKYREKLTLREKEMNDLVNEFSKTKIVITERGSDIRKLNSEKDALMRQLEDVKSQYAQQLNMLGNNNTASAMKDENLKAKDEVIFDLKMKCELLQIRDKEIEYHKSKHEESMDRIRSELISLLDEKVLVSFITL
jgi:molybdopterin converting factor small subunit